MSRLCEVHLKIDRWIDNSLVSIYKQVACSPLNKGPGLLNLIVSLHHVRKFFNNRQVTHNSHLYENQDFNVLKITNQTFKTIEVLT
jgi:hypothetical protein